jgi:hypothetical protein
MGHELHITRRKVWSDKGDSIQFEEFVNCVRNDPEFTHPGRNGEEFAEWRSAKTGCESWLWYYDGNIYTKNPEPELINKMVAIAKILKATAQGDDGEIYISATEVQWDKAPSSSPAGRVPQSGPAPGQWPLWKILIAAFLLVCVLLALKFLIFKK